MYFSLGIWSDVTADTSCHGDKLLQQMDAGMLMLFS